MNDLTDYTLATTIAVVLLAITQIVFLITVTVLGLKLLKVTKKADQTVAMSKDFVADLRQQQMRNSSIIRLGLFAFRNISNIRKGK